MAAPNLNAPTSITGKTAYLALSTTSETDVLVNAANSGKALRVTFLSVCNVDGTDNCDVTLKAYDAASAGTAYSLASTLVVPADSTFTPFGRDLSLWLEEDRRITATASAGGDLHIVVSYEEVS
jgi:hypothetical protein